MAPMPVHDVAHAFPSPYSSDHGVSPMPQGSGIEPVIDQMRFKELENRILMRRQSNPEQFNAIFNEEYESFLIQAEQEMESWRDTFMERWGLHEQPAQNGLSAAVQSHKKKRTSDEIDDDEEEEGAKGSPGWRCLFYEHDPKGNPQCGQRRYKRVSELRRHIKTHTLPHHCPQCGYRTAEERRLQNHKCEEGNRRRYSPVTEEDKKKHAELARMGIKVGQMKLILFGTTEGTKETEGMHGAAIRLGG